MSEPKFDPDCELCEAARMTTWWFENDVCWVAECEACNVPMVVWKQHDPNPSDELKELLWTRLRAVANEHGPSKYWIDDTLRSLPDHYHAHARKHPFA